MIHRSDTSFTFRAAKKLFELEVVYHAGRVQVELLRIYPKMEQAFTRIASSEQLLAQGAMQRLRPSEARKELVLYFEQRGYVVTMDG